MYFCVNYVQISNARSNTEFMTAVTDAAELIGVAGCMNLATSLHKRDTLVDAVVQFVVIDRMQKPLER